MKTQPILNDSTVVEPTFMFEKKSAKHINFKNFYLSQKEDLSPFRKKEVKQRFVAFKNLSYSIKKLFSPQQTKDEFSQEKQKINDFVIDLIHESNYVKVNQFLQKGFIPDEKIIHLLLEKTTDSYFEEHLLDLQNKNPLSGILAQILFVSKEFSYECHEHLIKLLHYFPNEVLHPDLFTDQTKPYNKSYKDIYIPHHIGNIEYATATIHTHNLCLNPDFSIPLFSYCLKRMFNHKTYNSGKYSYNIRWDLDSSLMTLYDYVKQYLTLEDKNFILNMMNKMNTSSNIESIEDDKFPFCLNFFHTLDNDISQIRGPKYTEQEQQDLLNLVPAVYENQKNDSITQLHVVSLSINEEFLLSEHQEVIRHIKNIHTKLSNHENLLDKDDIEKINKIVSETLAITIQKYEIIDKSFREVVKNIEGKNANILFSESLDNILLVMKDYELKLEQVKVNDLSLITRKNKFI